MNKHPALHLIRQRPQAERILTVEIKLSGVLKTGHDLMRLHSLLRLLLVRLQNRMPLDLLVIEEAICRYRFAPTLACLRHAGCRVGRHPFHQKPRSFVQARVAKVQLLEFHLRPGRRFGDQGVRSKAESKRETPIVYKRVAMSLKVSGLSRRRRTAATLCITTCFYLPLRALQGFAQSLRKLTVNNRFTFVITRMERNEFAIGAKSNAPSNITRQISKERFPSIYYSLIAPRTCHCKMVCEAFLKINWR